MNNKKLKTILLSMGLGVAMLTPTSVQAQMIDWRGEHHNGMFHENSQDEGLMRRGGNRSGASILGNGTPNLGNETFGETGSGIGNEPFGAPIGGGTGILIAAGLGYAFIQSKKNKQN